MDVTMLKKAIFIVVPLTLIVVTGLSRGLIVARSPIRQQVGLIQKADSLYRQGSYSEAFELYNRLSKDALLRSDDAAQFKIAYAAFKAGQYDSSAKIFRRLYSQQNFLSKYSRFFYIKNLWAISPAQALGETREYVDLYSGQALADSLLPLFAEKLFSERVFTSARYHFLAAYKNKVRPDKTAWFLIRAAQSLYHTGQKDQALDEFHQIIKKYPDAEETLELARWIRDHRPDFFQKDFFNIVRVYRKSEQYDELRQMLNDRLADEKASILKEKVRVQLYELDAAEGKINTAVSGFEGLLAKLTDKNLEPEIRLNLARIYSRIYHRDEAIRAYLDYAQRFPRRRLASEAMWKSAWLYEETNRPETALQIYRQLRRLFESSAYGKEAAFREGFTLYRLSRYKEAEQVFAAISAKNWKDTHLNRARYWLALCKEAQGDSMAAQKLRLQLAGELWDDYYTMKCYLLNKTQIDSALQVIKKFKATPNPFSDNKGGYMNLLGSFNEALQVGELLGKEFALIALSDVKLTVRTREDWIALAELYKKLGAYGLAYRTYDFIDRRFFPATPYSDKPFMIKERFPFYYDALVEKYGARYNIEKEYVLAVMKQESVYRPDAHSAANAYGLMQLIPPTAKEMAKMAGLRFSDGRQLFDPEINIHLGCLYLRQLHRQLGEQKEHVLAAYNAGPHRVVRWRDIPGSEQMDVFIENIQFMETRDYVRRVMKNYWAYKLLGNNFQVDEKELLGLK